MPGGQALLSGAGDPADPAGPTGATRVAGVIGDPVRHSLSPVLHNAAFRSLGIDWVYVAFEVAAGDGARAVDAVRALGLAGLSVTMPHKADVVAGLDRLGPVSARLGVVNTISWVPDPAAPGRARQLQGDSTDGEGFIDALRADAHFDVRGRRCLILGAGGSSRAVTLALAEAGAADVRVAARRREAAETVAALAGARGGAIVVDGRSGADDLPDAIAASDLVVNATPVGMAVGDGVPFDLPAGVWRRGQHVVDLIYAPATTPLLETAAAAGAATANGLGMLVRQAARQVTIWTGAEAPVADMAAAAHDALARRR